VLRLGHEPDRDAIAKAIREGLKGSKLRDAARGHGLYLVGGSFRALALLDMKTLGHPLPIVHQHRITDERIADLRTILATLSHDELKAMTGISSARLPTLPAAATTLEAMVEVLGPRRTIVSAFGLREGLLYRDLDSVTRSEDPLLAAALEVGERVGRFGDHGAAIDQWMDPLFPEETPDMQRLRLAACLLGDIAWNAHPDYRAERAVDMAIHGNWVGIDTRGRAILGRALCSAFGGDGGFSAKLGALLKPGEEEQVSNWGRALRLAQRLSGGTETLLRKTSVTLEPKKLVLTIPNRQRGIYADAVERRLMQLAKGLGRTGEVRFT
jgi:exopolyphosphatase/guanosine-5'-triphosphate,3'-diphosphate pyrophosphatase